MGLNDHSRIDSLFFYVKKKIDKRGRKLVDYDGQRHNFQSLQSNPKKRDELKVTRAREVMEEARRTYDQLNLELHDELPALYDSRVLFLVTNLQTLFVAEQVFHTESSKVRFFFLYFYIIYFFYVAFVWAYFQCFYFRENLYFGFHMIIDI